MLIVMRHGAAEDEIQRVVATIEEMGYQARPMPGKQRTTVGLVGNDGRVDGSRLAALPGVQEIIHVTKPYKQVSREWQAGVHRRPAARRPHGRRRRGRRHGGPLLGRERAPDPRRRRARCARPGATVLRGGAFKPRSSPYSFQGLGRAGLELLARAREETGLPIVTEAMDAEGLDQVVEVADIVQIGARNMQNYSLLKHAGRCGKPVLLKRGLAATIQELLLSAEYILAEGNRQVILCERGIRSFDQATRNLFDLSADSRGARRSRTCRSSPTRATAPGSATWSSRWRAPRSPRAPTGSWSRCTRRPTAPCPTARRASTPSSSSA